jgi:hypothetical protein
VRLSANQDSPFYDKERVDNADIYLNEQPHFLVIEADEENGWVDIIARDNDGRIIVDGDRARIRRYYGEVRIEIRQ